MRKHLFLLLAGMLPLLSAGCLQVEVNIQMHDDGGATITERVRLTQKLLELDSDNQLRKLLERPIVEQRMKEMGQGVSLVSHKVSQLGDGSAESVAVFKIADVEQLRLVNPFLASDDPNRLMRLQFSPIYKVVHSYHHLGDLMLQLTPAEKAPRRPPATQPETPPAPPTPRQLQILRHLQPTLADMMDGLEIKVRLVASVPISYGHVRDRNARSKVITLVSFTSEDLDAYGSPFVENEELMLDLSQLDFASDDIAEHVRGFVGNHTLPVFRSPKIYGVGLFRLPPNPAQFKKYFAGRPKSQGGDQPG